ncbi:MAG: hypothetical protein AAB400_01830 [Patescibacteria group bacterium]
MTDEQNAEVSAPQANEPKSDDQQGAPAASGTSEQAESGEGQSDAPEKTV